MLQTFKRQPHTSRRAHKGAFRRRKRADDSCASGRLGIPISAFYRDPGGGLCHDHCGSQLHFERCWEVEAVFRCLRCFEQVYIPFATFAWLPTRRRRREMSALELVSEWLGPGHLRASLPVTRQRIPEA
jgi:hypothetical protein